jgi:hypothetical protein
MRIVIVVLTTKRNKKGREEGRETWGEKPVENLLRLTFLYYGILCSHYR